MRSPKKIWHRSATLTVIAALGAASLVGTGAPASAEATTRVETVDLAAPAGPAGWAGPAAILGAGTPDAIPSSYIVVLRDGMVLGDSGVLTGDGRVPPGRLSARDRTATLAAVDRAARALTDRYGGTVGHRYSAALRGFTIQTTEAAARRIAADEAVAFVEQNRRVRAAERPGAATDPPAGAPATALPSAPAGAPGTAPITTLGTQPSPPSWGLDRIDQRNLPLDSSFTYPSSGGAGVHAYVIDSGIRFTHQDFGGRVVNGIDVVDGGTADDCYGHGSHVAGTLGGTTYGVAKSVTLVAVRVWACDMTGDIATTTQAIDWVTANAQHPAVANMSFGRTLSTNPGVYEAATTGLINSGVTVVASAGNDAGDACTKSPAFIPAALTVGNTWSDDEAAWLGNQGPCVDLFAPGQGIISARHDTDTGWTTKDGTSMAAPHVAGAAALILAAHPTWTPAQVHAQVLADATPGAVFGTRPDTTSRLLYVPAS